MATTPNFIRAMAHPPTITVSQTWPRTSNNDANLESAISKVLKRQAKSGGSDTLSLNKPKDAGIKKAKSNRALQKLAEGSAKPKAKSNILNRPSATKASRPKRTPQPKTANSNPLNLSEKDIHTANENLKAVEHYKARHLADPNFQSQMANAYFIDKTRIREETLPEYIDRKAEEFAEQRADRQFPCNVEFPGWEYTRDELHEPHPLLSQGTVPSQVIAKPTMLNVPTPFHMGGRT